jgi:hypothetical protein
MSEIEELLEKLVKDYSNDMCIRIFRSMARTFSALEDIDPIVRLDAAELVTVLGEFKYPNDKILLVSVLLEGAIAERSSRQRQFIFAKMMLKTAEFQHYSGGVFIFYDSSGSFRMSLIYPESDGHLRVWNSFRRFTFFVDPRMPNKTFKRQLRQDAFASFDNLKNAFSINAVTDLFYDEFFVVFDSLVKSCTDKSGRKGHPFSRDFVTLFAIRVIFLGFIQKKKWIGSNDNFIQSAYSEYLKFTSPNANDFYSKWLQPLFFSALNSPCGTELPPKYSKLSQEYAKVLNEAPYLNGGLFIAKEGLDNLGFTLPDKEIGKFFAFLFSHSFTLEENSAQDEDLQMNPEFLGIIFERLVNGEYGAVYTPRPEVDYMCRISLATWLYKKFDQRVSFDKFFQFVFKEANREADQEFDIFSKELALEVLETLNSVTVCDPAVGSGAFLVGMLQVIDELQCNLMDFLTISLPSPFERKVHIIRNSLYGVEVKEWAVWICQLRLWLTIFIDAPDILRDSKEPILPSLDFKVRQGDSLVQKLGTTAFPVVEPFFGLNEELRANFEELKSLKQSYFDNHGGLSTMEVRKSENLIFRKLIDREVEILKTKLATMESRDGVIQASIFGEHDDNRLSLFDQEILTVKNQITALKMQRKSIKEERPLIWAIEFAEIFGERGGFDLVIGNPPYLRHEAIEDPQGLITEKTEYKQELLAMLKLDFPIAFAKNANFSARSDLFTYFYIRGLRLLNSQGVMNYICSNSWLDIGYGVWLREFLVKFCNIWFIVDNQSKKSFSKADVNTIISVVDLKTPTPSISPIEVNFISYKRPFEQVAFSGDLIHLVQEHSSFSNEKLRVVKVLQFELELGGRQSSSGGLFQDAPYIGDKWGSKYLRSPDSYLKVVSNSKSKLSPLGNLAEIVGYVHDNNTGDEYPKKDFIGSIKDIRNIRLTKTSSGVTKFGVNRVGNSSKPAPILFSRTYGTDHLVIFNDGKVIGRRFYRIHPNDKARELELAIIMNSTFIILQRELLGIVNLGGGGVTFSADDLKQFLVPNDRLSFDVSLIEKFITREILPLHIELGFSSENLETIAKEIPVPPMDRAHIDNVVFDYLDLSLAERHAYYRETASLVLGRKFKSES